VSGTGHDQVVDDIEVGRRFRAVRTHKGWRQQDLAEIAGVSRTVISRIEHGRFEEMTLGSCRRVARALDMRIDLVVRWRGGDLDRMVNARHAALHESAALTLANLDGWTAAPEVSFNVYGERGAIDILAWHAGRQALLVVELKSEIVDVQGLLGAVDRYRRLAPRIARERGWAPATVSTWVAVAAGRANARSVAAHRTVLKNAFPTDGRRLAAWLRDPIGRLDALTFMPYARRVSAGRDLATPRRVRRRSRPK
jgi:transcriptional regulator with XRE-family HTH domain